MVSDEKTLNMREAMERRARLLAEKMALQAGFTRHQSWLYYQEAWDLVCPGPIPEKRKQR